MRGQGRGGTGKRGTKRGAGAAVGEAPGCLRHRLGRASPGSPSRCWGRQGDAEQGVLVEEGGSRARPPPPRPGLGSQEPTLGDCPASSPSGKIPTRLACPVPHSPLPAQRLRFWDDSRVTSPRRQTGAGLNLGPGRGSGGSGPWGGLATAGADATQGQGTCALVGLGARTVRGARASTCLCTRTRLSACAALACM